MGVSNPEQCRPEVSSLIHPDPDLCSNSSSCAESPSDQNSKSVVTAQSSSSSACQCLEFESESGLSASVSSSDYDLLYQTIEGLQRLECSKPSGKRRRRSKQKPCRSAFNRNSSSQNTCACRQACYCAASFAADCAAVCCCPCALVHLLILALVKVPSAFARKAFCYAKRKVRLTRKNEDDDEDRDEKARKSYYCTPPWSCRESPQRSGPLEGSPSPKLDTQKVWSELYAAGHMGFGALQFERN